MKKIKKIVFKSIKWKNKLACKLVLLTLSHFFVIAPIVSISAADSSSSSTTSYNQKYKIVATNDDNGYSQKFLKHTGSSVYVSKNYFFSWQKQINLLQNISLTNSNAKIFKVTIDRVNNSHNFKDSAFTIEDIETKAITANFETKPIIYYLKLDKSTKNSQVAKEFFLVNKAGKRIEAKLKWVNSNNKWNLELLYKQPPDGPGEDDSIYRYKTKSISDPKIIEEVSKADELVSLINSKITNDSGIVTLSKINENIFSVNPQIKNAQSFKEYSGIDLTQIPNIDKAIFSSNIVSVDSINVTIEIPNSAVRKIKYKILSSSITKLNNVHSIKLLWGFMFQTKTEDKSIYVGTFNQGLKELVSEANGSYSLETVVDPTNFTFGFMFQTKTEDKSIYVYFSKSKSLKKLFRAKKGSYSLETVIDSIDLSGGFMYQTKTADQSIYVGTASQGLKKLVKDKNGSYSLQNVDPTDVFVGFMYQTKDGSIYVGTNKQGLKKLVREANGSYSLQKVDDINVEEGFMYQTKDNSIYVGTTKGLKKLVKEANGSYSLQHVDSTNVGDGFMYQTEDKSIYVGTRNHGLKKLVREANGSYLLQHVDETNIQWGFMCQTNDGTIYVGTPRDGLKKLVKEINLSWVNFESQGTIGSGTLKIKGDVSLPAQVKTTYAKASGTSIPQHSDYLPTKPTSLSNGDKVYIKFAIKDSYATTHQLHASSKDPIIVPVKGLQKNITSLKRNKSSSKPLSKGAIAGIVIGSISGLVIIAGFLGVKFGKFKKIKFRK